jgi:hypothetical protein
MQRYQGLPGQVRPAYEYSILVIDAIGHFMIVIRSISQLHTSALIEATAQLAATAVKVLFYCGTTQAALLTAVISQQHHLSELMLLSC